MFDFDSYLEEQYESYLLRCQCLDFCECHTYEEFVDEWIKDKKEFIEERLGDEECI